MSYFSKDEADALKRLGHENRVTIGEDDEAFPTFLRLRELGLATGEESPAGGWYFDIANKGKKVWEVLTPNVVPGSEFPRGDSPGTGEPSEAEQAEKIERIMRNEL